MRAIVSGGMLVALDELGFTPCFDRVFGSSAGGINAAFYLQGERWHALSLYYSLLATKRFVDRWRVLRRLPIVDMRYVLEEVLCAAYPIDLAKLSASGAQLNVAITDVEKACRQTVSSFASSREMAETLIAGSWLPMLAGPPPVLRGSRVLDGGLLLDHPARIAVESGCTHVLALSTRYPTARRRVEGWQHALRIYLRSLNPQLADAYWEHATNSLNFRGELTEGNADPAIGPLIMTVAPGRDWRPVSRLEQGLAPLLKAAKEGHDAVVAAVTGQRPASVFAVVNDPTRSRTRGT